MEVVIFNVAQLAASGYAFWKGGSPERIVALQLLAASIATLLVPAPTETFDTVFWPVLWIDLLLLLGLTCVAACADRFWPTWLASCQLVTVAGHGVRAYDPQLWALAYWFLIATIAYPMLAMLVIGVWRHRRRLPSGREFAWTTQRRRHERTAGQASNLR